MKTQYIILPSNLSNTTQNKEYTDLIDQSFSLWKEVWDETFKQNKVEKQVTADNFFKQQFIPIIKHGDDIVAVHLYSIYNFDSKAMHQQSYLGEYFNKDFFNLMNKENIHLGMSMESLIVNPEYRKTKIGQSYFLAISYLGMRLFLEYTNCDAIFFPVRTDLNMQIPAYKAGFKAAQEGLNIHNTPVDLIYFKRETEIVYLNDFIKKQVDELWNNRADYSAIEASNNIKKVA